MAEEIPILMLLAGGTAMSATNQYTSGVEARNINNRNAAIAEQEAALISENARRNAEMVTAEAERVRYVKREEARAGRKEARKLLAIQTTRYGKSGVVSSAGTPLLVSSESAKQVERQNTIINEQGVYGYETGMSEAGNIMFAGAGESLLKRSQAKIYRQAGKSAYRSGLFGAGASIATGLGSMYMVSNYYAGQSYGFGRGQGTSKMAGKTLGKSANLANKWMWSL